jgi:hypothetical protein
MAKAQIGTIVTSGLAPSRNSRAVRRRVEVKRGSRQLPKVSFNAFAMPLLRCAADRLEELIEEILLAIARHEVGNRSGRVEPRRVKRRPKPHKLLNTPRSTARRLEIRDTCE